MQLQSADRAGEVAHVETTDEICVIADPLRSNVARCEQQASHFQPPRCEYEVSC